MAAVPAAGATLLPWGRRDMVIDPGAMKLYADKIPQAPQVLPHDSGHLCRWWSNATRSPLP